jgi:hypothetical protein
MRDLSIHFRACTTIHSIPDEIDNLYNRTELTTMKQKIHQTKKNMQEIKIAKDKKMTELKEAFDKEVKSVKDFRKELQTLLDNMEEKTIRELKQQFDDIRAHHQGEINTISSLIDAMNEVSSQLKKSEGNKVQEFVSIKTSEKMAVQAEEMKKEQQRKTEETFSFTADQNIKLFLQQFQTLGKVTSDQHNIIVKKDSLYKVKQKREIGVKSASDRTMPYIQGSCITENGILLLVDFHNNNLKHVDLSTKTVKDYIALPVQPVAVCVVNTTEVAVTIYSNNTVQFVSLGNKLTATHKLSINHPCWGRAHNNGKIFISDYKENVYIHDMNGNELKRISTNATGKRIFQITRHITVSAARDRVFVADAGNGVVILDIQGNYLSTLTNTVSGTVGVCTDSRNLFVSGLSSDLVQIGQDNELLGELVMVNSPFSLCFDHGKTRLIVTQGNSNNITVLDLE